MFESFKTVADAKAAGYTKITHSEWHPKEELPCKYFQFNFDPKYIVGQCVRVDTRSVFATNPDTGDKAWVGYESQITYECHYGRWIQHKRVANEAVRAARDAYEAEQNQA